MIRRFNDDHWLLISQLEHARIAAEMAEAWGAEELRGFPHRDELLSAIRHHDDGWAAWELAPTINEQGEPRDFTEMPMPVATAIWTRCVEACTSLSGFGGLWVSRHFCYLAERARESRDSPADLAALNQFLSQQADIQAHWREQLNCGPEESHPVEELGFRWLQTFDRISLWLCCADRSDIWRLSLPSGSETTFIPLGDGTVSVHPFPFSEPLRLTVESLQLPRKTLQCDEQLTLAQLPRPTIEWRLIAGGR